MNNIETKFLQVLAEIKNGTTNIYNYHEQKHFMDFWRILTDGIEKFSNHTFDGRFEKILFDELNNSVKNGYTYFEFFNAIKTELEKLSVPCIILIPLNFIDDSKIQNDISLSQNIMLFKTDKPKITYRLFREPKKEETHLEKYFKENIYSLLLRDHIEAAKDRDFFNFPLLTILVNNINGRVITESGRIVEAVYAFIRMLDFGNKLDEGGWGYMFQSRLRPADVYGVYYNKEGVTSLPVGPEANGYGYSMRFKFEPFLDVSTTGFLNSIKEFNELLSEYLRYCFIDKINYSSEQLVKIAKWQNSIQMFNTAYEFASKERYDSTIMLLLTLMESLFIKNKGNKKEHLVLALQDFFKSDSDLTDDFIRSNIEEAYRARNKFVHEGIGVDNEYVYSKPLNSYQGLMPGMKPFAHIGLYHYPSNIKNIKNIFDITIRVIRSYRKLLSLD
ncbi:MAG: hypothetical protein K2L42_03040 [Clostridia bacterium]|nr:hypothetical protein [Clostridia bacterium]